MFTYPVGLRCGFWCWLFACDFDVIWFGCLVGGCLLFCLTPLGLGFGSLFGGCSFRAVAGLCVRVCLVCSGGFRSDCGCLWVVGVADGLVIA